MSAAFSALRETSRNHVWIHNSPSPGPIKIPKNDLLMRCVNPKAQFFLFIPSLSATTIHTPLVHHLVSSQVSHSRWLALPLHLSSRIHRRIGPWWTSWIWGSCSADSLPASEGRERQSFFCHGGIPSGIDNGLCTYWFWGKCDKTVAKLLIWKCWMRCN